MNNHLVSRRCSLVLIRARISCLSGSLSDYWCRTNTEYDPKSRSSYCCHRQMYSGRLILWGSILKSRYVSTIWYNCEFQSVLLNSKMLNCSVFRVFQWIYFTMYGRESSFQSVQDKLYNWMIKYISSNSLIQCSAFFLFCLFLRYFRV